MKNILPAYYIIDSLAKFAIIVGAMWFNASSFDKTEVTALVMIALGAGGIDGMKKLYQGKPS